MRVKKVDKKTHKSLDIHYFIVFKAQGDFVIFDQIHPKSQKIIQIN